jgi:hypothetical protein
VRCSGLRLENFGGRNVRTIFFLANGALLVNPKKPGTLRAIETIGRPISVDPVMSALGSLADICTAIGHVRFTPESGHVRCS